MTISPRIKAFFAFALSLTIIASAGVNAQNSTDIAVNNKQKALRIIALSPHSVELLFSLGLGDNIVAATDYADYPEAAKLIPSIGGHNGIQLERVLELAPDLIVYWKSGNRQDQIDQLNALGFTTYGTSATKLTDVADEILALGKLTDREKAAKQLANNYLSQLSAIKTKYAQKAPVKVFYQLWSQPLRTASNNSWIGQLIESCQGENIFASNAVDYPQVSIENVIVASPDVIINPVSINTPKVETGLDWHDWPEIPAVKNNHIFELNPDLLHRSTLRAIDGLKALCEAIDKGR